MNDWNPETGIGPKPRNDGPAGSRKDHDRFLTEGLQGQPHADGRSTSGAGKMAMTQIFAKRYDYFSHSSLTALNIEKCKIEIATPACRHVIPLFGTPRNDIL
jgi:hypothetical protein